MGAEIAIPLILSAISAGTSYINTRNTQRKQDSILTQELASERSHQADANALTKQLLDQRATSTPEAEKSNLLGKFLAQVKGSTGQATAPVAQVGDVSSAYKKSGSDAALGITDYGTGIANLLSNIDAPGYQRQDEGAQDSRYQSAVGQIGNFNKGDDAIYQMRLHNVQPNPWLTALSQVAGAAAGSMGGGGGWGDALTKLSVGGGYKKGFGWTGSDSPSTYIPWTA